jgi:hypothetical protein
MRARREAVGAVDATGVTLRTFLGIDEVGVAVEGDKE